MFTDRQRRVERCRCALGQVSDPLATQGSQLIWLHGNNIFTFQADLTAGKFQARLGIPQSRQRYGGLARPRLADQRHHLTAGHVETDPFNNRQQAVIVPAGTDFEIVNLEQDTHEIILLDSLPPVNAEISSTIMFTDIVRVAIQSDGNIGAIDP